ncbi:MAG: L,D-transpeptidase family protein [Gammaproteobacteria bacterium]|nr:L,D-transpeptidase family protein [Gammaproteobacteria bacterium]
MKTKLLTLFISCAFSSTILAAIYKMPAPGDDIIGHNSIITVKRGDTFNKLREKYGVSFHELEEANPNVNPYRLRLNQEILVPNQYILPKYRDGIVINTVELRLYYFTKDGYVYTTPVGLGRSGWRTPTTATSVRDKQANPIWRIPKSIAEHVLKTKGELLPEFIEPGPDNPLGKYAIYLNKPGYLIHGTNAPHTVGKYYSSGCIRLKADAIEYLFEHVDLGTPVHLIHHANKVGWLHNELYLECHEPVSHDEKPSDLNYTPIDSLIKNIQKNHDVAIDWQRIYSIEEKKNGIPEIIGYARDHSANDFGTNIY